MEVKGNFPETTASQRYGVKISEKGNFPETTASKRYGVKTSEKGNRHVRECGVRSIAHVPAGWHLRNVAIAMKHRRADLSNCSNQT